MAAILLVLSFFSYTLIGAHHNEPQEEIRVEIEARSPLENYLQGQKNLAERMIMTALLEKDWPLYEEIIQNITLLFKGYAHQEKENLNGLDGVIAAGRFLDRFRDIHQHNLPSSREKLDEISKLQTDIENLLSTARMAPLMFSARALQNAHLSEATNQILLAMRKNSDHVSDTYGCNFTLPLFPGLGCALGQMKNIVGYMRPACSLMLSWAAPLPTLSAGHYQETFDAACNCYTTLEHGVCCIGSSDYHDDKSDICEYGLGCMSTQKYLATCALTLPFSMGQNCQHFAARMQLESDTIESQVYQLIKQEWRALINNSSSMNELKEALNTIKNEIAQEKTTYFNKR